MNAYIYGLVDPRDRRIHYIGHTIDTDSRLHGHIRDCADTPKTRWIANLASVDLMPELIVLDCVDYNRRYQEEYRWIYLGRSRKWPLTNTVAMTTDSYQDMANGAIARVFVEVEKALSWAILMNHFHSFRGTDSRYEGARTAVLHIGAFFLLAGLIVMTSTVLSSGDFPTVGMVIAWIGGLLIIPITRFQRHV